MGTFSKVNKQLIGQAKNLKLNVDVVNSQILNYIKNEVVYKRVYALNAWYTRIIGLDEVQLYQNRVVTLQEKLLTTQEKRRTIGQELVELRRKSNDLQEQLHKVKRQEDLQRFLELMREETEILKQEQQISSLFANCDREEREIFTAFSNAIRDSHEKQRAQIEYSKYLSLILSITGSFLVFVYSTLRKEDLKRFISENVSNLKVTALPDLKELELNQSRLNEVVAKINNDNVQLMQRVDIIHQEVQINNKNTINLYKWLSSTFVSNHNNNQIIDNSSDNPIQYETLWQDNRYTLGNVLKYGLYTLVGVVILKSIF